MEIHRARNEKILDGTCSSRLPSAASRLYLSASGSWLGCSHPWTSWYLKINTKQQHHEVEQTRTRNFAARGETRRGRDKKQKKTPGMMEKMEAKGANISPFQTTGYVLRKQSRASLFACVVSSGNSETWIGFWNRASRNIRQYLQSHSEPLTMNVFNGILPHWFSDSPVARHHHRTFNCTKRNGSAHLREFDKLR